jgi:hypothetical protein
MPRRLSDRLAAALALGAAILLAPAFARAGDWPQWRGPTGLGYTDEKDLPLTWGGKTNENVLWKVDLPKSHNPYSSPVAFKDKVVLTWATNEPLAQHVTCYQASDGKQLWDAVVPPGKLKLTDTRGTYCAGTPAADEAGVYVVFGSAVVAALDWGGNPRWRHDLERVAFDVCAGSSPILYKDTLIYLADMTEKKSSLIAFDRKTGALRWEALRPEMQFAHSTPAIIQVGGKDLMVIAASTAIQGADLRKAARRFAPLMVQTTLADYVRLPRFAYQGAIVNYRALPDLIRAVPLGEGFIDNAAFFAGLKEGGFSGFVAYEMCSPLRGGGSEENLDAAGAKSLAAIRQLIG